MTRKNVIFVYALILLPLISGYGADSKFGIRFNMSGVRPVNGTFRDNIKMSDYVNSSTGYSIAFRQQITKGFEVELQAFYQFLEISDQYKVDSAKKPGWLIPGISVSNIIPVFHWIAVPSLKFGADIIPWRFTDDGPKGETSLFEGEKVQKMSFGFHGGLELEVPVAKWFSIIAEARYTYLFCRDTFFFGETFSEQGIFSFSLGMAVFPF